MTPNRIRYADEVKVEIYNPAGYKVDTFQESGFHTVAEAIQNAYDASAHTPMSSLDYVYKVTNLSTGTAERYRINADGNVKILAEVHPIA